MSGYKEAALQYVDHGWLGVLPVPPARKDPVPTKTTGYDGLYPDKDRIKAWITNGFEAKVDDEFQRFDSDTANLALRMPNTIVGIDVDAYDGKKGRECLAHAEELWGELPPTLRSSSRIDGISGIRLYRVPPGTHLNTVITFPDLGLDGIEVIQYFHRYCIAWPSVHPKTGRVYRWLNHEGMVTTELPLVGSIPDLPTKWVEELGRAEEAAITVRADVTDVMTSLDYGTPTQRVVDCLNQAFNEIDRSTGGRHDETMRNIGRLLRLHHEEEPGVGTALTSLRQFFVSAVTDDGSRTQSMAESEWDRMLTGHRIHDKIASTPSRNKALEAVLGEKIPSLDFVMQQMMQDPHHKATHTISPIFPQTDTRATHTVSSANAPVPAPTESSNTPNEEPPDDFDVIMGTANPTYPPGVSKNQVLPDGTIVVPSSNGDGSYAYINIKPAPNSMHADTCDCKYCKADKEATAPQVEPDDGLDMFDRILLGEQGSSPNSPRTSWGPKDLSSLLESDDFAPEQPTVGRRDDGAYLFYAGKTNALIGPPESAKSWVAQFVASQEVQAGNSVLYLDFEDSERGVVGRMRFLGLDRDEILGHFLYADPDRALGQEEAAELFSTIDIHKPTLIVVDGMTAILSLHGYKTNDNDEVTRFYKILLEPLANTGAAVIVVDHVSKVSATEGGDYAIGAQMKLGALTGVQIRVTAVKKFGIGKEGKLTLTVHKDRPGGVRQHSEFRGKVDYWATVFVDARDTPSVRMVMRFENKEDMEAPNSQGKLHMLTDRVVEYLKGADPDKKGISRTALIRAVTGNNESLAMAIDELELNRTVSVEKIGRSAVVTLLNEPVLPEEEGRADLTLILGGDDDGQD